MTRRKSGNYIGGSTIIGPGSGLISHDKDSADEFRRMRREGQKEARQARKRQKEKREQTFKDMNDPTKPFHTKSRRK